jgi:hypothetical protein
LPARRSTCWCSTAAARARGGEPLDPADWLKPGGLLVIDDFAPMTAWPPVHEGRPDAARLHWLRHPRLAAAEVRVTPDAATIVATFLG